MLPSPVLQPPAGPNLEFVGPHAQASSSIPWVGLAVAGLLATPVTAAALSPDPASEERAAATRDLVSGTTADREAAVSLLSRLTRDPDGHAALLATGALPALVHVVTSREIDSQVRGLMEVLIGEGGGAQPTHSLDVPDSQICLS